VPDASWKAFERKVSKALGGQRRGADTRGPSGGRTDVIHDVWGVECKLLSRSGHADILAAVRQAERNSKATQIPIAIVKRKGDKFVDSICAMRIETWLEWYGPTDQFSDDAAHPPNGSENGGIA